MPQRQSKVTKLRPKESEKEKGGRRSGGEEVGGLLHLNGKEKLSCHGGEERGGLGRRSEAELIDPISVCRNQWTTREETIKED